MIFFLSKQCILKSSLALIHSCGCFFLHLHISLFKRHLVNAFMLSALKRVLPLVYGSLQPLWNSTHLCNHPPHRWALWAGPMASMGRCCWMSVRFLCRSVSVWMRVWHWPCTTSNCLQDGIYWGTNDPTALVSLEDSGLFETGRMSPHWCTNILTNYGCITHTDTHDPAVCVFVYLAAFMLLSRYQETRKTEDSFFVIFKERHCDYWSKTLLPISADECMDVTSCLLSPRCVGMCVLCSMRYWKWLPFNFYFYRQIWWLIYILHSHSGTPPPLPQRQSGTEHILHYDSGSTDVWVNHSRLSPLLTDELSLCNCRSYPVSQR